MAENSDQEYVKKFMSLRRKTAQLKIGRQFEHTFHKEVI